MKGAKNFAYDKNALVELGVICGIDAVRAFRCHPEAIVSEVHFTYMGILQSQSYSGQGAAAGAALGNAGVV